MTIFGWVLAAMRSGGHRGVVGSVDDSRDAGRARGEAVRAAAAVGADHRAQRRSGLSSAPARAGLARRSVALAVQGDQGAGDDRASRRDRAGRGRGRRGDSGRARARARRRVRQLPGRGRVPAQPRRAGPPDRVSDGGHVSHQPGAVRSRDAGQRRALRHVAGRSARLPDLARSRRHRHDARRPADSGGRPGGTDRRRVTTASSAARRSSTRAAAAVCRRRCCSRARGT